MTVGYEAEAFSGFTDKGRGNGRQIPLSGASEGDESAGGGVVEALSQAAVATRGGLPLLVVDGDGGAAGRVPSAPTDSWPTIGDNAGSPKLTIGVAEAARAEMT